jgi:hypothetical protein
MSARRRTTALAAVLVLSFGAGCARETPRPTAPAHTRVERATTVEPGLAHALEVQDRHTRELMRRPGVAGVGTGLDHEGRAVIRVFATTASLDEYPTDIDGVPVEIVPTGGYEPWGATSRYRPVAIGISLDNDNQCSFGTLGCVVTRGARRFVLTCNHVLARQNQALLGEAIVQPARVDNRPTCADRVALDQVASLTDFEPLRFDGSDNVMDAAIGELSVPATCATLPQYYGAPGGTIVEATPGLAVQKVGRTTALTTGTVTAINASFDVTYAGGTAHFVHVIVTSNGFGKPGDSGSLMVTNDGRNDPVGMVFGGDNRGSAIVIPIAPVLARFKVDICRP